MKTEDAIANVNWVVEFSTFGLVGKTLHAQTNILLYDSLPIKIVFDLRLLFKAIVGKGTSQNFRPRL